MFGSNFLENFGIPNWQDFPLQGTDAQGGLFGFNQPQPDQAQLPMSGVPGGPTAAPQSPLGLQAKPDAAPRAPNAASPLSPGEDSPLTKPDVTQTQPTPQPDAPAAGIGTDFKQPRYTGTVT